MRLKNTWSAVFLLIIAFAYDSFVTVNGVRASESLKSLQAGANATFEVQNIASNNNSPRLTIESDRLAATKRLNMKRT